MLYLFKSLLLLINIDSETVLTWFGIGDSLNQTIENNSGINISNLESSTPISLDTFRLIIEGLWEKIQDGLTLADIENVLFFILFIRFLILALRYNLKTSFYITCIGLAAGYLWYKHLLDLIALYRGIILKLPFLHKLGVDGMQLRNMNRQNTLTDLRLGENVHWYNPILALYYAFTKGIINIDPETGFRYYIDPISMVVSNLGESSKSSILPIYYKIYNTILPKIFEMISKFWNQLSGVASYSIVTRIGKRYCPYLVRWHWTLILIVALVEQVLIYFTLRIAFFQSNILVPQAKMSIGAIDPNLLFQINFFNVLLVGIVLAHFTFVIFGLLHAVCGQYFYIPFFVENTELHIGPRPVSSVYSGGKTAWQNPEEKKQAFKRSLPKLWYGWFGRGSSESISYNTFIIRIFRRWKKKIFKKLRK